MNIYQLSLPPCSFLFVELRRTPSSIELGRSASEWSATILDDVPTPRGYPREHLFDSGSPLFVGRYLHVKFASRAEMANAEDEGVPPKARRKYRQ